MRLSKTQSAVSNAPSNLLSSPLSVSWLDQEGDTSVKGTVQILMLMLPFLTLFEMWVWEPHVTQMPHINAIDIVVFSCMFKWHCSLDHMRGGMYVLLETCQKFQTVRLFVDTHHLTE